MAWMGRYHRVNSICWIVWGSFSVAEESYLPATDSRYVSIPRSPGDAESLADAVEGVDKPLVVEVVLALDKTAKFVQQLGVVSEVVKGKTVGKSYFGCR